MEPTTSIAIEVVITLILILVNGLLAMVEMAMVSARKTKLQRLVAEGRPGARSALRLVNDPTLFLSTAQIGISLVGIIAGAYGAATIAHKITPYVAATDFIWLAAHAEVVSTTVVVLIVSYLSLVLGELVPKRVALANPEAISTFAARPMLMLARLARPLERLLSLSTHGLLHLMRLSDVKRENMTEEEIKLIIGQATKEGVVKETEQDMIEGVLKLDTLQAYDLMTPRHEMSVLDLNEDSETTWNKIFAAPHSFLPVVDGGLTHILGLVATKDLFFQLKSGTALDLKTHLIPPLFVPETAPALRVLEKFKNQKTHMAFVVDEHGGVEGLISVTDLLEAIVGSLPSPAEDEEPEIVQRHDGSWLVDGSMAISELKETLKIKRLPGESSSDYSTVGGFTMARLGRIPKAGDTFKLRSYRFEVVDMDRHRVDKVLIERIVKPEIKLAQIPQISKAPQIPKAPKSPKVSKGSPE